MQKDKEYRAELFRDLKEHICAPGVDRIFIYGAGRAGLLLYFLLRQSNIFPYAFVVTHKAADKMCTVTIPVLEYRPQLFDENDIVIIAALGKAQEEIKEKCSGNCCKKIVITEDFHKRYSEAFREEIEEVLIKEKMFLYRSGTEERKTIGKFFKDVDINSAEFVNKFMLLTKNLEPSSRDIIVKCIQRVRRVNSSCEPVLDIFTEDEKKEMAEIRNYFKDKIIRSGDKAWIFRGYFLPQNNFSPEIFYGKLGIPLIENLDWLQDKDIIDVGGFIGDSALVLSEMTKRNVHVFEPVESNLEMIEETRKLNQIKLSVTNMAVSDKEGIIPFSIDKDNSTCSDREINNRLYEKKIDVRTVSIDVYVEKNDLCIGLIKIHAEGMEQEVIKGASKVIREQSPVIIVEIGHTESDFFDIKPMLENMNPDYKFRIYKPSNGLVCLGMKLIAEVR